MNGTSPAHEHEVIRVGTSRWMVRSGSTPGAYWQVQWWPGDTGHGSWFTCSCPAGTDRGRMTPGRECRHVRAVAEWEQGGAASGTGPRRFRRGSR